MTIVCKWQRIIPPEKPVKHEKNIILIGMPGSGKSTIGVVLAKTLNYDFCDVDLLIQRKNENTLQALIQAHGIDGFLQIEEDALCAVQVQHTVIATGGSAVFSEKGMWHLKQNGLCVYLDVEMEELSRRLKNIKTRGIAAKENQSLNEIYAQRKPFYEAYADIRISFAEANIPAASKTVEWSVEAILLQLQAYHE